MLPALILTLACAHSPYQPSCWVYETGMVCPMKPAGSWHGSSQPYSKHPPPLKHAWAWHALAGVGGGCALLLAGVWCDSGVTCLPSQASIPLLPKLPAPAFFTAFLPFLRLPGFCCCMAGMWAWAFPHLPHYFSCFLLLISLFFSPPATSPSPFYACW